MKTIFSQKNLFCLPWSQTILKTHLNTTKNPFVLTMAENIFRAIGAFIGKTWKAGKNLRKKSK